MRTPGVLGRGRSYAAARTSHCSGAVDPQPQVLAGRRKHVPYWPGGRRLRANIVPHPVPSDDYSDVRLLGRAKAQHLYGHTEKNKGNFYHNSQLSSHMSDFSTTAATVEYILCGLLCASSVVASLALLAARKASLRKLRKVPPRDPELPPSSSFCKPFLSFCALPPPFIL